MMEKRILVTGGAGYIGSHTVLQLLLGGYNTVVVDNLDNSTQVAPVNLAPISPFIRAKYGIEEMYRDQWNWASKNPYGYGGPDSDS